MAMRRLDLANPSGKLDESLLAELDMSRLPAHVAIIMDGNGRWAARRSLPSTHGSTQLARVRRPARASFRLRRRDWRRAMARP